MLESPASTSTDLRRDARAGEAGSRTRPLRVIAGAAGLGYVAATAIENMEVVQAPMIGSPVAEIRAAYENHDLLVVSSFGGALALVFYLVFVAGLFGLFRAAERRGDGWAIVALVGGVSGAVLAATGLAAKAVLVANGGEGFSDDLTRALSDLSLEARLVAGLFLASFLAGAGIAALRSAAFPAWLAVSACVIAVPLALTPLAAFTGERGLQVTAAVAFGLDFLWVFAVSLWLALAGAVSLLTFLRRATFLVLVLAAGLVGIALLAVPGASGTFFSWGLKPEPLAAYAGGAYLGSAAVYAAALFQPWPRVRGLVVGAVVLSVSVFAVTLAHLGVFDFDRLQAWAWVVLFGGFSLLTSALLALGDGRAQDVDDGSPLAPWARAALAGVATVLAALAVALWAAPTELGGPSPFALSPLGGRFAGSWVAMLAAVTAWSAVRNRSDEVRYPALALVTLPAGVLLAALRTLPDLEPAAAGGVYIAALALLVAVGVVLAVSTGRSSRRAQAGVVSGTA